MVRRTPRWSASALALLLIIGVNLDAGAAKRGPAVKKTLAKAQITEIQQQGVKRMKGLDKAYAKQAKAQARYYKRLIQQMKKSGGNVQPLLDAAAYFDSQAKK